VIEVLDVMMKPAGILLRFGLILGSFWLVPMAWRLLRDEAKTARREAQIEQSRLLHPAGTDLLEHEEHLPYDYEAEHVADEDEALLAVYDAVIFDGFLPDADRTYEEVATRVDLPVERVRARLSRHLAD
jgi:DNA-directed RNA polymerase specialized sigma24 family protein